MSISAALLTCQAGTITRIGHSQVGPVELLELCLGTAEVAVAAATIEVRVADSAGYAKSSPAPEFPRSSLHSGAVPGRRAAALVAPART